MAGAGDRDVAEARVEQIRVDAGIGMNEDSFGSKALRAMTGYGIPVVEMPVLPGVELDLPAVVEAGGYTPIEMNRFDSTNVTIGHAQGLVRCGELDALAY